MDDISDAIISSVILGDTHPLRFEAFCNEVISFLEGGLPVVPTSRSWDLGRDGRDARGEGLYVCATLDEKIDKKSADDIRRLVANATTLSRVYFCSSKRISEKACSAIELSLRGILPTTAAVVVHGADQLAKIALEHPAIASKHYPTEISECIALLRGRGTNVAPEEEALRLSLMTLGSDASDEIRRALYLGLLRSVLSQGPRNMAECLRDVAARLHLARAIPPEVLQRYITELTTEGEVETQNGRYHLTAHGGQQLSVSEAAAAAQIVDGRTRIRLAIEHSSGQKLLDQHYERIWMIIRQKMSHFFYTCGRQMVEEVGRLLDEHPAEPNPAGPTRPLFFIEELASAVAETAGHPAQSEELHTAVRDIFTERTGSAFEWLASLCAAFVGLCSLGLEATTGRAIGRMIGSIALVLDTDVVLSLLNRGESDHESVQAIAKRWKALRGHILVGEPVLQEVAHHAWIAEYDFLSVKNLLPGSAEDRGRLIENSFVRGFAEMVASGEARVAQWTKYIRQYKGSNERDVRPVADMLRQDYGIAILPRATGADAELEKRVRTYLDGIVQAKVSGRALKIAMDKGHRDAALYAGLVTHYRALRQENADSISLLVSSARRLVDIEKRFTELGEPHMVISIGMAVYLLSLVPGVSIGLGALSAILFDGHLTRFNSGMDRVLLRVVRESPEVDLPWGKRFTLLREVRERLLSNAKTAGVATRSIEDKERVFRSALTKRNAPRTAEVLRESLDAVVVDTRTKREAAALRQQVKALEKEVTRLRERRGK